MTKWPDAPACARPDEFARHGDAIVHAGCEVWQGAFQAFVHAVRDAADEASFREVPACAPRAWLGVYLRGARTYGAEMAMVLPRAACEFVRDIDGAGCALIEAPREERGTMRHPSYRACRRLVDMYIVDPDPRLPADKCLVWQSEPKLTDLSDEELWFEEALKSSELIKKALKDHNDEREKLRDPNGKPFGEVGFSDLQRKVVARAQF